MFVGSKLSDPTNRRAARCFETLRSKTLALVAAQFPSFTPDLDRFYHSLQHSTTIRAEQLKHLVATKALCCKEPYLHLGSWLSACTEFCRAKGQKALMGHLSGINHNDILTCVRMLATGDYCEYRKLVLANPTDALHRMAEEEHPYEDIAGLALKYQEVNDLIQSWKTHPVARIQELVCEMEVVTNVTGVALACVALFETRGLCPYATQVIAVLTMSTPNKDEKLKGRVAQVLTGEGKSAIVAMLALTFAFQRRRVHVVTTTEYLAERDAEEFSTFFKCVGKSVSFFSDQPSESQKMSYLDDDVIYATAPALQFHILRGLTFSQGTKFPRFDVAIIDEVDSLLLDRANSMCRIALPSAKQYEKLYPIVYETVKQSSNDFTAFLTLLMNPQTAVVGQKKLMMWTRAVRQSQMRQRDVDYIVHEGEIVIIDRDTGRMQDGCRWEQGIHEFVELREGVKVNSESLSAAAISAATYFGFYDTLCGLTGTIGIEEERAELQTLYHVKCYDVPPNRKTLRVHHKLEHSPQEFHSYLIHKIREVQPRPCLVLFEKIVDVDQFDRSLKEANVKHRLLHEKQQEDEEVIISLAGCLKAVTVATNTAGRGTDIRLHPQAAECGGLHVIFAFYPSNMRVQMQGFGRSARKGQKGSAQIIIDSSCPTEHELEEERLQRVLRDSKYRIDNQHEWHKGFACLSHFAQVRASVQTALTQIQAALSREFTRSHATTGNNNDGQHAPTVNAISVLRDSSATFESFFTQLQSTLDATLSVHWAELWTECSHDDIPVVEPYAKWFAGALQPLTQPKTLLQEISRSLNGAGSDLLASADSCSPDLIQLILHSTVPIYPSAAPTARAVVPTNMSSCADVTSIVFTLRVSFSVVRRMLARSASVVTAGCDADTVHVLCDKLPWKATRLDSMATQVTPTIPTPAIASLQVIAKSFKALVALFPNAAFGVHSISFPEEWKDVSTIANAVAVWNCPVSTVQVCSCILPSVESAIRKTAVGGDCRVVSVPCVAGSERSARLEFDSEIQRSLCDQIQESWAVQSLHRKLVNLRDNFADNAIVIKELRRKAGKECQVRVAAVPTSEDACTAVERVSQIEQQLNAAKTASFTTTRQIVQTLYHHFVQSSVFYRSAQAACELQRKEIEDLKIFVDAMCCCVIS